MGENTRTHFCFFAHRLYIQQTWQGLMVACLMGSAPKSLPVAKRLPVTAGELFSLSTAGSRKAANCGLTGISLCNLLLLKGHTPAPCLVA